MDVASVERLAQKAIELDGLQRWRRILVPLTLVAIVIHSLALHRIFTSDEGWVASVLAMLAGYVLVVWAIRMQLRIEKLEDELG